MEYFDFYPKDQQLHAMQDRVMYPVGSNENFVHNVFYILQKVAFPDKDFIRNLKTKMTREELSVADVPMNKFLDDEPLQDIFDPVHLNIPKINFTKAELLRSVS